MGQQGKAMGTWKGHTSCGSLGSQQLSSIGVTGSLHPIAVSRAWVGLPASWGFPSSFKIRKLIEPCYSDGHYRLVSSTTSKTRTGHPT